MNYLAHITLLDGVKKEQSLHDHCMNTAKYAAECLDSLNLGNTAYIAGLLHDMGKATKIFNDYLEAAFAGEDVKRGSVNHTFAGVIYILEKYHKTENPKKNTAFELITSEIIAYAIGSHHGIFDCLDLNGRNGFQHRLNKNRMDICYEEAKKNYFEKVAEENEIENYFKKSVEEIQNIYSKIVKDSGGKREEVLFQLGLVCRMLLSAVIYADRKDTGEFMRQCRYDSVKVDWKCQKEYLEKRLEKFDTNSLLNQVRKDISLQCAKKAKEAGGIYRLYVPTGAGKTLAALRYALTHVSDISFGKKKIIFVIPLLSVLDQNAKVIRENLAEPEIVLEHHSNVVKEKETKEQLDEYELLTDTWEAPFIVTTLVQFLNVLFLDKTSAIRRMNGLCNSVIVIDEVQSLPRKMTMMFNMALNFLSKYCNATIVLSSATQPCFEEIKWPMKFPAEPDIVRLTKEQKDVFERSDIVNMVEPYGMSLEEGMDLFLKLLQVHPSLLVICNTKKEARIIFSQLQDALGETVDLFHLSTSMCQAHRENELEKIQSNLKILQKNIKDGKNNKKIICVTTQLAEAGIDFSFSGVVRILAGIDNLAQASGRCNRSNEYEDGGKVYLIKLKGENLRNLPDILQNQKATESVLENLKNREGNALISEEAVQKYYRFLYKEITSILECPVKNEADVSQTLYLAQLLADQVPGRKSPANMQYFFHQPFKTAGRHFQVFENETIDVLVPYEEGKEIINKLENINGESKAYINFSKWEALFVQMKKYTVSIYHWQKEKLLQNNMLTSYFDGRILVLELGAYHDKYGVDEEGERPVDEYFFLGYS